jgi:hypothetical protein
MHYIFYRPTCKFTLVSWRLLGPFVLLAFAYQGKDIVFGFILEYNSSLRDFGPYWVIIIIGLFLKDDILACVET